MFTVNRYESVQRNFGSNAASPETTVTNFANNWSGMKYNINGGGRDTYIG